MPANPKIATVFATMNRSQTAVSCVLALASQTQPPAIVIVADNTSSDSTVADLRALPNLPFQLIVHEMPENLGNAGGIKAAIDIAISEKADAFWILDDDSWPRHDCLEKILALPWRDDIVRHPLQIDPVTGKFTWPMLIPATGKKWRLIWTPSELHPGPTTPSRTSWTGALIPKAIHDTVGPVNAALFIRGEDEEYPWRIEVAGYATEAVNDAAMDHPGPQNLVHLTFLGRHFFFEKGLPDWKFYYKTRNMTWLKLRQSGKLKALATATAYTLAALRFDGFSKLPLSWRAARAGWLGKLGKMP